MEPAIIATGLRKSFGNTHALDGVDLTVPKGTVLGLLGPNGAGKTTTVKILTTQLVPDAGSAQVLGHDVIEDADALRHVIGLAGQYAAVDERLTGRENLVMIGRLNHLDRRTSKARAAELLGRFELSHAADRPVSGYSGGMRRRLDLAASLVNRPPVLFLDEPTTGLDPKARLDLWGVIAELVTDGTTLLLTTQYLEEADRLADRIMVIDHGRVIAEGTGDELKATVGSDVIAFVYADPSDAARAAAVVGSLGDVTDVVHDHHNVEIYVPKAAKVLGGIAAKLEADGLIADSVEVRRPTLDDVFLALTGDSPDSLPAQPADAEPVEVTR